MKTGKASGGMKPWKENPIQQKCDMGDHQGACTNIVMFVNFGLMASRPRRY